MPCLKQVLIATKWRVRYSFTSKVLSGYFKEQFYPICTEHTALNISDRHIFSTLNFNNEPKIPDIFEIGRNWRKVSDKFVQH